MGSSVRLSSFVGRYGLNNRVRARFVSAEAFGQFSSGYDPGETNGKVDRHALSSQSGVSRDESATFHITAASFSLCLGHAFYITAAAYTIFLEPATSGVPYCRMSNQHAR